MRKTKRVNKSLLAAAAILLLFLWSPIVHSEPVLKKDDSAINDISFGFADRRIIISRVHLFINGEAKSAIPYGYGMLCAVDQGLDGIAGEQYNWMPGIRFEGGYVNFKNNGVVLSGTTWSCGPLWLLPLNNNRFGNIALSTTFGMSYLKAENEQLRGSTKTFTAWAMAGYEYSYRNIVVQAQVRYMYIYDREVDIHNLGGGLLGIGLKV